MTDEQLIAAIKAAPKAANLYIEWERPAKLRAAYSGFPLYKHTRMMLRIGVEYDNMISVQQGRVNGDLPAENAGLVGKEWVLYPYLKRSMKTGKLLLSVKLAVLFGKRVTKAETRWIVREAGIEKEVKKEDMEHMLLASETRLKEDIPITFDLTGQDVLAIHNASVEEAGEAESEIV